MPFTSFALIPMVRCWDFFAFGLLTKRSVNDKAVPYIAVASPVICFLIETATAALTGYQFGYELLMLNGLLTFAGAVCRKER